MTTMPAPVPSNADHTASTNALHLQEGPARCTWRLGADPSSSPHAHFPVRAPGRILDSVLEHIGNTPLVRLHRIPDSLGVCCEVLAKCEFFNAGGSVKDRIGKRMVEDAERSGRIRPGDVLIEPTSGNTGIGLALAAALKGYGMIITLPEKMSQEKVDVLKALGAEIIRTPTEAAFDSPDSHIGVAKRLNKETPRSHILDQYSNPSNPLAHYDGTAEEILHQCEGRVDCVVVAAGTGGTITGIARKLKERLPHVRVVGVDPVGSILAAPAALNGKIESYKVEGIGYDFVPVVLDRPLVDEWIKTSDAESFHMARRLIREEGLLVGGSSGSAMVAAMKVASGMAAGQRCVVILADGVRNYMSKFLNDSWMIEHGYLDEKVHPNVSERPHPSSPRGPPSLLASQVSSWWKQRTVSELRLETPYTVTPAVSCQQCVDILVKQGYDQLPCVGSDNVILGMVTLGNLTSQILSGRVSPDDSITRCLYTQFKKVALSTRLSVLSAIFDHDHFALVVTNQRCFDRGGEVSEKLLIFGIVTRIDLLNFIVSQRPRGHSSAQAEDDVAQHASEAQQQRGGPAAASAAMSEERKGAPRYPRAAQYSAPLSMADLTAF